MPRELETLERIQLLKGHVGWKALREVALAKLQAQEGTINRLIFRTRSSVDPLEIEYYRGFRQGVMYVLDGLPNAIESELKRALTEKEKDV